MPSQYFGLNIFPDALQAFAKGDAAQAMTLTEQGSLEFPDQIGLTRFFAALSAQSGISVVSHHLGRPFPIAYRLPCLAPFQQWPSSGEVVLTDTLRQMHPDQMLLVYALGPYRTNGPFQEELRELIPLYAHAPDRIAAVHLITSHGDRPSDWRGQNQIEDQARTMGLPLRVLQDPTCSVGQALRLTSSPSLFVLDHNGTLLAPKPWQTKTAIGWPSNARCEAKPPSGPCECAWPAIAYQRFNKASPMQDTPPSMSAQDALVAVMVAVSAADEQMRTSELVAIQRMVNHMPVFVGYDLDRIRGVSQTVFDLFEEEDGLEALFGLIRAALPERLGETAYALACDVVSADGKLRDMELRMLEEIREELNVDRLHAAAIEWGARVRHMKL